jgi:hypothetical protein
MKLTEEELSRVARGIVIIILVLAAAAVAVMVLGFWVFHW